MTYFDPHQDPDHQSIAYEGYQVVYNHVWRVLLPDGKWYAPDGMEIYVFCIDARGDWKFRFFVQGFALDGPSSSLMTIEHKNSPHRENQQGENNG